MVRAIQDPQAAIGRLNLVGLAVVVLFFGVASAWAVTVQLAGAVTASGTIVVESAVKKSATFDRRHRRTAPGQRGR